MIFPIIVVFYLAKVVLKGTRRPLEQENRAKTGCRGAVGFALLSAEQKAAPLKMAVNWVIYGFCLSKEPMSSLCPLCTEMDESFASYLGEV